jgi:peptidoglycan/xylan/chitin deacetylase (PgdA/CDA1 family)
MLIAMLWDVFGHVSLWIYLGIVVCYSLLQVYGSAILSAQFFLPVKFKGDQTTGAIAITFDDGPIPGKTEKVLGILKRYDVAAAFFCIGHRVKENRAIIKRIHEEGHVLGNHSYWHGKMFDLQSANAIASELKQTDQVIFEYAGVTPRFFRPPYGVTNPMVAAAVTAGDYVTVGWSVRSLDTVIKNGTKLLDRVTSSLKAGDVIIFHDHSDSMLEILPSLLDHVQKVGLKIVRIDELLNEKAYV